jgi:hypothetical protein
MVGTHDTARALVPVDTSPQARRGRYGWHWDAGAARPHSGASTPSPSPGGRGPGGEDHGRSTLRRIVAYT